MNSLNSQHREAGDTAFLCFCKGYSCPSAGGDTPFFVARREKSPCLYAEKPWMPASSRSTGRQAGFYLDDDEDFLYLKRGDKVVAVWSANKVTVETVQAEI